MSAAATSSTPGDSHAGGLRLRIDDQRVSDIEVAAVSVAVTALLGAGGAGPAPEPEPAWRRAGMLEASTARRIRSPGELRSSEAR